MDKYKALLHDIQEKEDEKNNKDIGMEISWGIDLKEKTDQLVKEKLEGNAEKTSFQKYLDKRKEKRKEKRELKKKGNREDSNAEDSDIPSDIDMNESYFAEEFNNPEFKKKTSKKNKDKGNKIIEDIEESKQKQNELGLLLMNEESVEKKHFNLKEIIEKESESKSKKKRNKKQNTEGKNYDDDFKVNVEDKRFSAIFTSHHYNIDPTDPHYKKTKGVQTLIDEKIKRRNEDIEEKIETKKLKQDQGKEKRKDVELNMLVKNVKRNAQTFRKK